MSLSVAADLAARLVRIRELTASLTACYGDRFEQQRLADRIDSEIQAANKHLKALEPILGGISRPPET